MCLYRAFSDFTLAKRMSKAEQDLIKIKTNQQYFMNSVIGFESNVVSSTFDTHYDGWGMNSGWTGLITFVGDKPSKDVVMTIKCECYDSSGNKVAFGNLGDSNGYPYIKQCNVYKTDNRSNICYGFLDVYAIRGESSTSRIRTIKIWVIANDNGVLSLSKQSYEF